MAKSGRGDFTDILVAKKVLSPEQLTEAKALQSQTGIKLQDALVKLGYTTVDEVMAAIREFHSSAVRSYPDGYMTAFLRIGDRTRLRSRWRAKTSCCPMSQENGAAPQIIISDPTDFDTMQKLQFILNKDIQPILAAREQIIEAINRHYGQTETESVDSMLQEFTDTAIDFTETEQTSSTTGTDENDAPVVKLVNLIITEAISLRASDIHVEPFGDRVRVRYRIDGVLVERDSPPRRLLAPLLSRIKIMSNIDIAERRRPQDGRIKMSVQGKHFDMRVSILPTNHGQSAVMRILDRGSIQINIQELGFAEDDYARFQQVIKKPNGIFLVTGPTGSGKTTTLYAALNELNRPDRKIITAEDPVEYYLPGINQVEVKHKIGLDFQRIIRAMLRQAPNIILVGEIRDHETAEIAVQASLTGHLVFSTLHTNDAPSAVTRLVDIGVQPFLIASSVIAIMAQRLVRLVCPKCKEADKVPAADLKSAGISTERAAGANFMRGRGCNYCHHTGYRGRKGIYELLKMTAAIREMTFNREPTQTIRRQARLLGMRSLLEDGLNKAIKGITTLDEVLSICHHEIETDVA